MPLQISEFRDVATVRGVIAQLPAGRPDRVVNLNGGQSYTVPAGIRIVRIAPVGGSMNVNWGENRTERFDQGEFRQLEVGTVLVAVAV